MNKFKTMKNFIKDFIFFFPESKKFTGYGYFRIIFLENGIKRAIYFCNCMRDDREIIEAIEGQNDWHIDGGRTE